MTEKLVNAIDWPLLHECMMSIACDNGANNREETLHLNLKGDYDVFEKALSQLSQEEREEVAMENYSGSNPTLNALDTALQEWFESGMTLEYQ